MPPMDCPFDPLVAKACAAAEEFARRKRRPLLETTHLFFGLLQARGPLVEKAFRALGKSLDEALGQLEQVVSAGSFTADPEKTLNYQDCQRLALDLAWQARSNTVREQDLLWALVLKARASQTFPEVCQQLGLDLDRFKKVLEQQHPCPNLSGSMSFRAGAPGDGCP